MQDFVGSKLTNPSFAQMAEEVYSQILITTAEKLKLDALAPLYADAIERLKRLILRQTGFAETEQAQRADQNRDALWRSIYYSIYYLRYLSADHSLYPAVQVLLALISPYKGLDNDEYTKETSEIDGFLSAAQEKSALDALKKLGLQPLLEALSDANASFKSAITTRTGTSATRAAETGTESTDSARRAVVELHHQIVARVNAVAELEGTADVTAFINQANAIAEHYEMVMRNQGKKTGKPVPAAETGAETPQTPTPAAPPSSQTE